LSVTRLSTTEPFVTRDAVCEFLAVSPRTVDRMVKLKLFPVYRPLGPHGPVRFRLSDVEKAMRQANENGKV
jgi:excisionase family DNA binding protein